MPFLKEKMQPLEPFSANKLPVLPLWWQQSLLKTKKGLRFVRNIAILILTYNGEQ
jgi:hypothetical protein